MQIRQIINTKFIKFCLVGGLATILNYIIFYILLHFANLHYLLSAAIGFMSGVVLGFILNSYFTFQAKGSPIKYFAVYCVTLILSLLILKIQVEYIGINVYIANVITIGLITFVNFTSVRKFVFS